MVGKAELVHYRNQIEEFLVHKLLPFWFNRSMDARHGGFVTHFDKDGKDTGEDEKSLIAQSRSSCTHRASYTPP